MLILLDKENKEGKGGKQHVRIPKLYTRRFLQPINYLFKASLILIVHSAVSALLAIVSKWPSTLYARTNLSF
jgi:hypothetical protein